MWDVFHTLHCGSCQVAVKTNPWNPSADRTPARADNNPNPLEVARIWKHPLRPNDSTLRFSHTRLPNKLSHETIEFIQQCALVAGSCDSFDNTPVVPELILLGGVEALPDPVAYSAMISKDGTRVVNLVSDRDTQ